MPSEPRRLLVSFSGGQTSGYMSKVIKDAYENQYDDVIYVFGNTGEEDERCLRFVDRCDREFGLRVVWVEALVHHGERRGTGHRVVTFETASRNGEPYESHIQKYGIPNKAFPHCTRELKYRPIHSYAASLGWKDYDTAIGIRTDERRRVAANATQDKVVYPLLDWFPSDKQDVNSFWEDQSFSLGMQEHEGNCRWCWKKSDAKLLRLMTERPAIFDFPARMERTYPRVGAEFAKDRAARDRTFFRMNRSVEDLRKLHAEIGSRDVSTSSDADSGCTESCELYETEIVRE